MCVFFADLLAENLRGYYTKVGRCSFFHCTRSPFKTKPANIFSKYDCSSADLAPLGSISKNDAKDFQRWARAKWDLPILDEFIDATPTAELLPLSAGVQSDEVEMGLTYSELSDFGKISNPKLPPCACDRERCIAGPNPH